MYFLNLGLGELLGLAGAISAGVVALYLLDRSKRKQVVATLRFWSAADVRTEVKHRKRIQQPWSLLLQLLSLLLLLLAIAGPRLGVNSDSSRDHVLILDTSAWMGARARQLTLMDEAKASARAYLRALPSRDRVMIVRADALATPATPFESNRATLEQAIRESQPSASALNLPQAFQFAERAQALQSQRAGEIVFAGVGRVPQDEATISSLPPNLRVLPTASTQENVGLRKIGLRRSPETPDTWEIFVAVKNYGVRPHDVDLALQFGGAPAGSKHLTLAPGAEEQSSFTYKTKAAGYLEARINPRDAFPQDDRAVVELPSQQGLHVVVYSDQPQRLRPLFGSNPQVDADFQPTEKYDPQVKADLVVLDKFAPVVKPKVDGIWIDPPAEKSPVPVKATRAKVALERWRPETTLGAGLRSKDVVLDSAEIFNPAAADIRVAEASDGPLIVARPGTPKIVVVGFEPLESQMKYELTTPLMIANILRWIAPDTFRRLEVQAGTVGTVSVPIDAGTDPASIKVITEDQRTLPFTVEGNELRFFAGAPATVRVLTGDRESVYSLTLPDVAEATWKIPQTGVRRGIPRSGEESSPGTDLWPWLAVLGGTGLLVDWLLFGRSRAFRLRAAKMAANISLRRAAWRKAS